MFANQSETAACGQRICSRSRALIAGLASLSILTVPFEPNFAKSARDHLRHGRHAVRHAVPSSAPTRALILIDADTGRVLYESNADARAYPASLVKMMTLYLTFQALKRGQLALDQRLPVSAKAARQEPTKLWLKPGERVRVRDLMLGLTTRSANDAAVVLAEGIAGSEAAFAKRMTSMGRRLGMKRTVYRNASGLPDRAQYTTARDLARLALALYRDYPREYEYFSKREFDFRGQRIAGHNHLLEWYRGADGIKTGYTRASGFNLAASAERNEDRLIGVILGSPSWRLRDEQMASLLDRGFVTVGSPIVAGADPVLPAVRKPSGVKDLTKLAEYVAPIAKAEAAAVTKPGAHYPKGRRPASAPANKHFGVQFGAFHTRKAANKLAQAVSDLTSAKGKSVRVLKPDKLSRHRLYRVQLLGFTERDARTACAQIANKTPCFVFTTVAKS
jgi:D-alanyl-D-alanine carboxypeptidase